MATIGEPVTLIGDLVALGDDQARVYAPDGTHLDFDGLSDATLAALDMLDGQRSWGSLLGTAPASQALFAALDTRGLLRGHGAATVRRVRLYGCGPLGWRIASELVRGASMHLTLVDSNHAPSPDLGLTAAEAAAERLRSVRGARVNVDEHWPVGGAAVDLAIVASTTVEPDRAIVTDLVRNGVPALLVRAHHTNAVVGPLLRSGARACLHCYDLTRSAADPAWPVVVSALSSRTARPSPVVVGWAAGVASAVAEAITTGYDADLEASEWRWDASRPGHQVTTWSAHPSCGCRFGQAA